METGNTERKKGGKMMDEQQKNETLHAEGASKERDERLAKKGTPLGEAVEANKEKKVQGKNFPAT
jgi:hypothetical protein